MGNIAESVAGGRTDQRVQACPTLVLAVRVGDLLREGLVGVLPALILGLFGSQLGAALFADAELVLQLAERAGELLVIEVAVVLRLMIEHALVALLQQHIGLLDGFFAVLQALAQFADMGVVDPQQVFKAGIIQFRMTGAPVGDFAAEFVVFAVQACASALAGP